MALIVETAAGGGGVASTAGVVTSWDAAGAGDILIPTAAGSAAAAWPSASLAFYMPMLINVTATAQRMTWLNGGTVSGNVDVGIYDLAGNALVRLGGTAQAGVSATQVADIADTPLTPAYYFLAMAMDNTTGIVQRSSPNAVVIRACGVQQQAVYPLPAVAAFAAVAQAYLPLVAVLLTNAS